MARSPLDGEYDAILVQTDSGGTPVREVFGPHLVIGTGGAPASAPCELSRRAVE